VVAECEKAYPQLVAVALHEDQESWTNQDRVEEAASVLGVAVGACRLERFLAVEEEAELVVELDPET
jgi:hypothetical protein